MMPDTIEYHLSPAVYDAIKTWPKDEAIAVLTSLAWTFQRRADLNATERQAMKMARQMLWEVDTLVKEFPDVVKVSA